MWIAAQLVERRTVELQRTLGHWFGSGWSECFFGSLVDGVSAATLNFVEDCDARS